MHIVMLYYGNMRVDNQKFKKCGGNHININNINMDKYKIGEVVHLKATHGFDKNQEITGTIIFEYLGRGLNGLLKLKEGDQFVIISDNYEIELKYFTLYEFDEMSWRMDTNRFRKMVGRHIHSYDVPDDVLERLLDEPEEEMLMEHLGGWIKEANIPIEDRNRMFNSEVISELMEKYKREPLNEEEKKHIKNRIDNSTMHFGVIKGENDIDIPVVYFGDGSDKSKIHQYHIEGYTLVVHSGDSTEWGYYVGAYPDIADEMNNPTRLN